MSRRIMNRLYAIGALYLLYLAYQLFESRGDVETTMTPVVRYLFIALFVLAGAGMLIYSVKNWNRDDDDAQDKQDDTKDLR